MARGNLKSYLMALVLFSLALTLRDGVAQEKTDPAPAAPAVAASAAPAVPALEEEGEIKDKDVLADLDSMHLIWVRDRARPDGHRFRRLAYVVQYQDTMWRIAEKYLNSPYYWPKIWERNPHIVNPHLIFPGDVIYVYPDGVIKMPVLVNLPPNEVLADCPSIIYVRNASIGFVDKDTYEKAGRVIGNRFDKELLGREDYLYVSVGKIQNVQLGEQFHVFRLYKDVKTGKEMKVLHPKTGELIGYLTQDLGEVEVTKLETKSSEARVYESWQEITDGDLITPLPNEIRNERAKVCIEETDLEALTANIVATKNSVKLVGENDIIYIDRGSKDGVVRGNLFYIFRPCEDVFDRVSKEDIQIPEKIIGHAVVLETKEFTSTLVIVDAIHESTIGEWLLLTKYNDWEIEGISSPPALEKCELDQKCRVISATEYEAGMERPFCNVEAKRRNEGSWVQRTWDESRAKAQE